ncbi:MAG: hypothetical protein ACTSUB_04005 [Candidatus Thorarchaeota archaeon]
MDEYYTTPLRSTHIIEFYIIESPSISAKFDLAGFASNITTSDGKIAETIETGFSEWSLPLKSAKGWGKNKTRK